jgi:hypothetical protein
MNRINSEQLLLNVLVKIYIRTYMAEHTYDNIIVWFYQDPHQGL